MTPYASASPVSILWPLREGSPAAWSSAAETGRWLGEEDEKEGLPKACSGNVRLLTDFQPSIRTAQLDPPATEDIVCKSVPNFTYEYLIG
jgi:hypothetical protein